MDYNLKFQNLKMKGMYCYKCLLIGFLLLVNMLNAQEISARVIDSKSQEPVAFATIKTGKNKGVITNGEGLFVIDTAYIENKNVQISCMGYTTKSVPLSSIAEGASIALEPALNQLETVFLSSSTPNVDAIIEKVNQNYFTNYRSDSLTYKFFKRFTTYGDFESIDLEIDKSSEFSKVEVKKSNQELSAISNEIKNSNSISFDESRGKLLKLDSTNSKLRIDKVTKIFNSGEQFSIEAIEAKSVDVVLKYLDTTQTYKLKTGWFTVEDELSLNSERNEDKEANDSVTVKDEKSEILSILNGEYLNSESTLKSILDTDIYEYELENASIYDDELIYEISFSPKRSRAKYKGTIYVSDDTFAILKMNYDFEKGKRGDKLNLKLILGIKYIENLNEGTMIFSKAAEGFYVPKYLGSSTGSYFYAKRPFKFIENSAAKNKTAMTLKLEGQLNTKTELLFETVEPLEFQAFESTDQVEQVKIESLRKYDANQWTGSQTLAPTEELRKFEATEK